MADEANEAALLERRQEIRTSLKAVENSLKEAGAVTDGYSSAYLLESAARADLKPSCGLFCRQIVHASAESLARSAASRFAFDAPDPVRYRWRLSPLGEVKCRRVWSLFDADGDEMWTHAEFLEYMAALGGSRASEQLEGFERSGEVWRMYMSDVCELDDQGRLTFEGFVTYREMVEDERPLARDLVKLGIALEWEELERLKIVKRLFDEYVDDPTGNVTAQVAQYLLADIGFVLTREETVKIIERRYQFARCLRFIHQLKRTLRLFGYRQKSALRFSNEGLARAADSDEQPRICKAGLLSLVFSSWCPARKTRWRKLFLRCRLLSFCALRRLKQRANWAFASVRQAAATGLLSAGCLQSRTPGVDRGDYMMKLDVGPKFSTAATVHLAYNSDADSAATLHELKYLERGAECFLYIDVTCKSGTKESDAQMLSDRLTWLIGEFFRDHIESLPFFHRWFVTLPTKQQLRMGPSSSAAAGSSSAAVVRLVILFTGKMDLYHVMQSLGLPSSMQFDHLVQRFSLRLLCSHSLEDLLVTKSLNVGAQWSCRTQMELRLNRQAWAQVLAQVGAQLDAELDHEREDAEYIAQGKAEREQKQRKSPASPTQHKAQSTSTQPGVPSHQRDEGAQHTTAESRQRSLIQLLNSIARALKHSQHLSSTWAFTSLAAALEDNQWLRSALSPQWLEFLTRVLGTPGGLAAEWKALGDSLRAEFADTSYAHVSAARPVLGHRPSSRTLGSSSEFTLAPFAAAATKTPTPSRLAEAPAKLSARTHHNQYEPSDAAEATEEKSTEDQLLEFYDMCARHLQGIHVVRAEAGTSGVTCVLEGWNVFSLLPRIHQGQLAKKASLIRSGTFSSRQPLSSRSLNPGGGF